MADHDYSQGIAGEMVYERTITWTANGISAGSGAPSTVWTSGKYAFDGATTVKIEAWGHVFNGAAATESVLELWIDGAAVTGSGSVPARFLDAIFPSGSNDIRPFAVVQWDTPSAGMHQYSIVAWRTSGTTDFTRNRNGAVKMSRDLF